jgi:hypothetical protein
VAGLIQIAIRVGNCYDDHSYFLGGAEAEYVLASFSLKYQGLRGNPS